MRASGNIILRGGMVQLMGIFVGNFGWGSGFGSRTVLDQEEVLDQVGPSELNYSQDLQQCHHIYLDDVSNALGNVIVPNNIFGR